MPTTIEPRRKPWKSRLGWFALLYAASFGLVTAVAYGLKAVIPH